MSGQLFPGLAAIAAAALVSCSHPGGDYEGYMTRSYTVRGQSYHPMGVDEALRYRETGIASWYDESTWLGFKRGKHLAGREGLPLAQDRGAQDPAASLRRPRDEP